MPTQDILNAVLSAVWGVPTATMTRCSLSIPSRKSMCTPDVHPPFAALVSAFRTLGGVINRWVDMVYALIVYGEDVPCPASTDLSGVFADPIWSGLAGSNSTALVRMTSTSFAITDGTHVDYVDHTAQVCFCRLFGRPVVYILTTDRQITRTYLPGAWSVTPSFGIAAVRLPEGSADVVGLLGCTCIDLAVGIGINCTMLGKSGPLAWTYPVEW